MREICTSGSEGGGAGTTGAPYPITTFFAASSEVVDSQPSPAMAQGDVVRR